MHDVEAVGYAAALGGHKLKLADILLQLAQAALEQHPARIYDAHAVADVLELAQVVRAHQDGRAALGHVGEQQRPDLPAHDGVEPVDRLVEDKRLGPEREGQPEGRLLLHAAREAAYGRPPVEREGPGELFEAPGVEARVFARVKAHHVVDGGLREVEDLVGYPGHARLDGGVFKNRLAVRQRLAGVGAQHARYVAQGRRLARAVRAHEAVDRARWHAHVQGVERRMRAEALCEPLEFKLHLPPPPFRSVSRGAPRP